jgi:hypothetical protein
MSKRLPILGLPLLLFGAIGCDRTNVSVTAPTAAISSGTASDIAIAAEPATLRAEAVANPSCLTRSPFGARIIVRIRTAGPFFLRGLRFRFTDRFGLTTLPRVMSIPGSAPLTVPVSSIPIPTSPSIPMPGLAPLPSSSPIPFPDATFPFLLLFDCGAAPEGTVFVDAEVTDMNGRMRASGFQARLGF